MWRHALHFFSNAQLMHIVAGVQKCVKVERARHHEGTMTCRSRYPTLWSR